jgi:hypothetical protein
MDASPLKPSLKKRPTTTKLVKPLKLTTIIPKAPRVKKKPTAKQSLVVQLIYRRRVEIMEKIKDIVEIQSRRGRTIKPTQKHVIKQKKP